MSRANRRVHYARFVSALLIVLSTGFSVRDLSAGQSPAQNTGSWVLHQSRTDLGTEYDPRRDPEKDLAAAVEEAKRLNRNIFVVVGGEWCSWCHTMDRFFQEHAELRTLRDKNYVHFKVNMSQENPNRSFLSQYPKIRGYPHIFILGEDGRLIRSQPTDELENGKTYNEDSFKRLLERFAPKARQ